MGEQLGLRDGPCLELLLPVAPGFFAVAREKVREAGAQVSADVPADGGNGIPGTWRRGTDLTVTELGERAFGERLVAPVLSSDGLNDRGHVDPVWLHTGSTWPRSFSPSLESTGATRRSPKARSRSSVTVRSGPLRQLPGITLL